MNNEEQNETELNRNSVSHRELSRFVFKEFERGKDDVRYYFRRFELELRVFRIEESNDKRDLILRCIGPHLFRLVNDNFDPVSPDEKTYEEIKEFLINYFKPTTNIHAERTKFSQRFRQHGESVSEYVAALRALAVSCMFKNTLDERLRDQLILGINDAKIQELLFREHSSETETLGEVEKTATNYESALLNRETVESVIKHEKSLEINKISYKSKPSNKLDCKQKNFKTQQNNEPKMNTEKFKINKKSVCIRCGEKKHSKGEKCRAENAICRACKSKGHFEKVCVRTGNAEFIYHVNNENKYKIQAIINKKNITLEYDTGAGKSIIPETFYNRIGRPKLLKTKPLYAYPFELIPTLGEIDAETTVGSQTRTCKLTVVPGKTTPILGKDLMKLFNIEPNYTICRIESNSEICQTKKFEEQILKEFSDVFDQKLMGTIKTFEANIQIAEGAPTKICKARPVPYAIKPAADKEIDRLVGNGTLEPIDTNEQNIEWASPVVYVTKKNGQIRLCGDFKSTINPHMVVEQYPYPTFEDVVAKLNGCTEFSVIDLKDAFLQVKVSKASQKYLTIATHRGYYRFKRMPFGISAAPIIFQKLMDKFLMGLEGVTWFQDDIAVGGSTRTEHLQRLHKVFEIFRRVGLKTQQSKLQLFRSEITFLGHRINKDGILPNEERIRALREQPEPTNVSELRSFLGSVNYYSRFVRNLQSLCSPLHNLLTKNTTWKWTKQHQKTFEQIRQQISSETILTHFDPSKPIILACDASTRGVGAVLQHRIDGQLKLIAAASRTLNTPERNYSNIDREALAIMFGIQKFHKYLVGVHFTIQSDHKPLERILSSNSELPKLAVSRLTRWAITLSAFDYEIEHIPGKDMSVPDALSRLPLPDNSVSDHESSTAVYRIVNHSIYELYLTRRILRTQTEKDPILNKVIQYIERGWPQKKNLDEKLYPYFEKRDELTYEQKILMWNNRIVIPESLKQHVIEQLHESHTGIVAMKSVARMSVWYPCIDRDIERIVKACIDCGEHQPKAAETPLLLWNNTGKPWDRIHMDLAFLNGEIWLFIIDSHSRWLEICKLKSATSEEIIECLNKLFSSYGICRIIVTDNGSQFTSAEFRDFCNKHAVRHIRTTPYHSRSNGMAERVIRTFKNRFRKTQKKFKNQSSQLQQFLFSYRTTEHRATHCTPAKLFLYRELPTFFDRLKPDHINDVESLKSKFYHDRKSTPRDFNIGDKVWVRRGPSTTWKQCSIADKTGPLSYRTSDNQRVHADHLLKRETPSTFRKDQPLETQEPRDEEAQNEYDSHTSPSSGVFNESISETNDFENERPPSPLSSRNIEQTNTPRKSSRVRNKPNYFHEEFDY